MSIKNNSRLQNTVVVVQVNPVTGLQSVPPFVYMNERVTETDADDRIIISDGVYHWAQLALSYLSDAKGWWVIADLSSVIDPFTELTDAKELRCPSVERYLFKILHPGG